MRREWVFFDRDIIEQEFLALSDRDQSKLAALMQLLEGIGFANPAPAQIDDYGDGVYRLRHIKSALTGSVALFLGRPGCGI